MQLQKSSELEILLKFVKTEDEYNIVKAFECPSIGKMKSYDDLLAIVAKWRLYMGMPKDDNSIELALVRDFIVENYPFLTVKEIELAYNLCAKQKLENCNYYGYFSPFYVGQVLDSYLHYRKDTMSEVLKKKDRFKYLQESSVKPSPEEESEVTKDMFRRFYENHKNGKEFVDPYEICWKTLRKHKWLELSKEETDEALEYANKKVEMIEKDIFNYFERKEFNKEYEIKVIARAYCIQKFFDKLNNIDELLEKITPEIFKK
jgi:hypothetical protein